MLIPTEAIATALAISSAPAISSTPASSSAPAELSAQKPPSVRESPDPTSRTPESSQHGSHWPSPEKAGMPKLEGGCHSTLGSSGDISISHSGVSCGHRNVPHASVSHNTTSAYSSGLRRPPSRTLLHYMYNGSFPSRPTPRSERLVCAAPAHPRTISLYGSSSHNNMT